MLYFSNGIFLSISTCRASEPAVTLAAGLLLRSGMEKSAPVRHGVFGQRNMTADHRTGLQYGKVFNNVCGLIARPDGTNIRCFRFRDRCWRRVERQANEPRRTSSLLLLWKRVWSCKSQKKEIVGGKKVCWGTRPLLNKRGRWVGPPSFIEVNVT